MTEPKEEKCEACYGSGYINFWTDDGHISMRTCRRCDGYGYIKVEPMTNEEYLKSLDTEQLAEFLAGIININPCGYLLYCNECGLNDRCCEDDYPSSKEAWVEWLKQPHK